MVEDWPESTDRHSARVADADVYVACLRATLFHVRERHPGSDYSGFLQADCPIDHCVANGIKDSIHTSRAGERRHFYTNDPHQFGLLRGPQLYRKSTVLVLSQLFDFRDWRIDRTRPCESLNLFLSLPANWEPLPADWIPSFQFSRNETVLRKLVVIRIASKFAIGPSREFRESQFGRNNLYPTQ